MSKAVTKLTDKQRRFVEEYCVDCNATDAARRAGYSEKTAHAIGWENLRKPEIARAIEERMDEFSMSAAEVTKRLTDWGRGDISPFLRQTATGEVKVDLSTKEARDHLHLVRKIKATETRVNDDVAKVKTEIELHDAKDAVVQMGKIRGLYADDNAPSVQVNVLVVRNVDELQPA